jgi:heat shock protein HtpX
MFSSGMLLLTIVLLTANIILFILVGTLAVLILIVFQLVTVLLSDKIIARTANWRITKENPNIHLMSYELPVEDYKDFQLEHGKDALIQIKAEIYEKTLAIGKALNCEVGGEVLSKYGFKCSSESILTKIVPVYEIVRKAADMFKLPIPKIVVSNTMTPNAAASGPSPNHGVMLITTGLLVELKEEEILSVVGHEFGHLKGMDPLVLFAITSAEFLFRFYIFWPLIINSGFNNFGFYYLLLSLGLIYFIAKLFESRADLQSAITIGQPTVLAEALRKIGFQRLQYERLRTNKILDWIGWDTHPPIYFRIGRLEKLEFPDKIRHLFIQSIKDNTRGFIAALH